MTEIRPENHLGLVYMVANNLRVVRDATYDDMVGDGMEALVRLARTYDGRGGFVGYALPRLRWAMLDGRRRWDGRLRPDRPEFGPLDVDPPDPSFEDEVVDRLDAVEHLAALPPRLRVVAEAAAIPGGQSALARLWGVTDGAVTRMKYRIRRYWAA